ncbi:hypothetical protein SAMN02745148_00073 [Modicisalibacter ilicicola DSM 19980]|uniref:Uncharacterized protein n=1 Tax=Modicisalibacter ilicicola DSM 19980 TaxID=1121942 RepID=A0A1M4SD20_9GAMM|nr:hypothetical protein [Halomonas ilicicola]SHE30124.1 hypothetical protein SAMN02745148_00073 [Halomonas ilicicola DSM 19980]
MRLKRWHEIRDIDLPYVESSFFAVSKVEALLGSHGALHSDLERLGSAWGFSFMGDGTKVHQRLLEEVKRGTLYLLLDPRFERPFSPVAQWTGSQWRLSSSALWQADPSLEAKIARLNAQALTPDDLRKARWPSDARASPAPAPRIPETIPEPIVEEPPPPIKPGFHIVRLSGTREQVKQRLFPYTPTPDVEAMFERLNGHLGDYLLPGEVVVLADPASRECREDEEYLMAEARRIQDALYPLGEDQRQTLMNHWQAYEDIALSGEAMDADASALSNTSTALGATSAAGSRAVSEVRQAIEEIDRLYRQAMDPHNPMTRTQFFAQREQRFKRLGVVMNNWVNAPLRLPRHTELKSRINIEARQQLHSVDTARTGGKFRIPTISEAITKTAIVSKLTSIGSFVGVGLDVVATQATIEQACSEGRERECTRTKYVEYGGLLGRAGGAAAGVALSGLKLNIDSKVCLAVAVVPHGRIACAVVSAGSGAIAGEKMGGQVGEKFGAGLFTRIYGESNNHGSN